MGIFENPTYIRADLLSEKVNNSNDTPMMKLYMDACLMGMPAEDVVKVVRCKDCGRGHGKFLRNEPVIECQLFHHDDPRQYKDLMDYCSHGVRRDMRDD